MDSQSHYVPGVCNINHAEIVKRRMLGMVMSVVFVVLGLVLVTLDIDRTPRLLLFLPAFAAASGFLQAKYKFCVSFAAAGIHNANDGDRETQRIVAAAALKIDRRRALKINLQSAALALAATVLVVAIPNL